MSSLILRCSNCGAEAGIPFGRAFELSLPILLIFRLPDGWISKNKEQKLWCSENCAMGNDPSGVRVEDPDRTEEQTAVELEKIRRHYATPDCSKLSDDKDVWQPTEWNQVGKTVDGADVYFPKALDAAPECSFKTEIAKAFEIPIGMLGCEDGPKLRPSKRLACTCGSNSDRHADWCDLAKREDCICASTCWLDCKGQCGCQRCHDSYADFLSSE